MFSRIQKKLFLTVTSYWAFSVTFYQFLTIYNFEQKWVGFISVGMLSLTALLIPYKILRYPVYLISSLGGLYILIPMSETKFFPWLANFYAKLQEVSQIFVSGRANFLPHEMAAVLLLFTILILIELLVEFKQVWLSALFLVGYLLILAIYNSQNFYLPILLVLAVGLLQHFYLNQQKQNVPHRSFFPIIFLLVILAVSAVYLPKEDAQRAILSQTSHFRNWLNDKGVYHFIQKQGLPKATRTGFSENDEQLGGPIFDDNQIVFEALQTKGHYWRVESKSLYTGSGWQTSQRERAVSNQSVNQMTYATFESKQQLTLPEEIAVKIAYQGTYLPIPYGLVEINLQTNEQIGLSHSIDSDRIDASESLEAASVLMNWQDLDYSLSDLASVPLSIPKGPVNYLQLPDSLPMTVQSLTESLVAEQETLIQKVQAIESYLKTDDLFRYSKVDALYPDPEQDFVAHFLFESHVGYCDHFSSAMTVMLRSIGIPARWVKGFASGDPMAVEEDRIRYAIRNNDAHSWVEVYFEGYGWLPFEPTPSFSQPLQEEEDETVETTNLTSESTEQSFTEEQVDSTNETASIVEEAESSDTVVQAEQNNERVSLQLFGRLIGAIAILFLAFGTFYLYKWRVYLITILLLRWKKQPFEAAYPYLLKQFEPVVKRQNNQSLIEYAYQVEQVIPSFNQKFIDVTKIYEAQLYGRQSVINKEQLMKIKQLAKQISQTKIKAPVK